MHHIYHYTCSCWCRCAADEKQTDCGGCQCYVFSLFTQSCSCAFATLHIYWKIMQVFTDRLAVETLGTNCILNYISSAYWSQWASSRFIRETVIRICLCHIMFAYLRAKLPKLTIGAWNLNLFSNGCYSWSLKTVWQVSQEKLLIKSQLLWSEWQMSHWMQPSQDFTFAIGHISKLKICFTKKNTVDNLLYSTAPSLSPVIQGYLNCAVKTPKMLIVLWKDIEY